MCSFFRRLKHFFRATRIDVLHSPFVFKLYTTLLDRKVLKIPISELLVVSPWETHRYAQLVFLNYLNIHPQKTVLLIESHRMMCYENGAWTDKRDTSELKATFDCIYSDLQNLSTYNIDSIVHNDTVVFVPNPHHTNVSHDLWNNRIHKPPVTVSIDLFDLGILLFRKEQVTEHFVLRYDLSSGFREFRRR